MSRNKLGIYAKKDKTFYYLETGENYISNEIDRVKKTLIQRSLISISLDTGTVAEQYKVLELNEAKEEGYKITPIFLNNFVKQNFESKEDNTSSKWS